MNAPISMDFYAILNTEHSQYFLYFRKYNDSFELFWISKRKHLVQISLNMIPYYLVALFLDLKPGLN